MTTTLEPCPFCGEAHDIEVDNSDHNASTWVICHGCGARGAIMKSMDQAVKAWNSRAVPVAQSPVAETREALAALPPLPEPEAHFTVNDAGKWTEGGSRGMPMWTADQMQAYARAALSTPAAPAQPEPISKALDRRTMMTDGFDAKQYADFGMNWLCLRFNSNEDRAAAHRAIRGDEPAQPEPSALPVAQSERKFLEWAYDTLIELNPSNYDHDDACECSAKSVEVMLAIKARLASPTAQPVAVPAVTDAQINGAIMAQQFWRIAAQESGFSFGPELHDFARAVLALAASPQPGHAGALTVTDEMVGRFLSWPLPKDFGPDCGIVFHRDVLTAVGHRPREAMGPGWWPVGTNLLTFNQAKEMLEHVLGIASKAAQEDKP